MNTPHTHLLREWAKFFSGLVCADIIFGIWIGLGKGYGSLFFGIPLTQPLINIWIIVDALLLLLLVHYAWFRKSTPSPSRKTFYSIVGSLLTIVALAHFLRLLFSVPVTIGTTPIPLWISVIGTLITGFLAYASFRL